MTDSLRVYKALGDDTRLRLMRLLSRAALNVNELREILQMGQSRVSRHLRILADAELISSRREGTWIYYQWIEGDTSGLVGDTLAHLRRHERTVPQFETDFQRLEAAIERRKEQTRQFFDNVSEPTDLDHRSLNGQYYRGVALSLLPQRSDAILDMGTGSGLLLPALAERARQVIAVDASHTMLELARQTLGRQQERCDFRLGDLEQLPVADAEVDAVVLCMVLHHLSHPAAALAEAHRVLKPGGWITIVDLHQHTDESLREQLADLWLGFDPKEVSGWLKRLRFTIAESEVVGEAAALKLITFKGQKRWHQKQPLPFLIKPGRGEMVKPTTR
jgi:ubiquinone/menaquinone biosynthesis C-methylase UbiE/DNA-binding transcriptional ArsR family regulator